MAARKTIGWREWVSLPDLGLPAIKAKVDTGARTSALHAHTIETFGPASAPLVRFAVNPIAGRTDVEITCSAPVVGRRDVTSSNGEREARYVIETHVRMGTRTWPIEMTLTNRQSMTYRMLLGRQAIGDDMFVDAATSFRQAKLSYKPYKSMPRRDPVRRSLRIAILTQRPQTPGLATLAAAAGERGHVVETIGASEAQLQFDGLLPGLRLGRTRSGHFDAVIPQIEGTSSAFARNVLRQLELMGAVSLNSADALDRLANPLAMRQTLAAGNIAMLGPASVSADGHKDTGRSATAKHTYSVLVVGRSALAEVELFPDGGRRTATERIDKELRRTAVAAARLLGLRLAAIDVVARGDGLLVSRVSAMPQLERFARETGIAVEERLILDAERQVRSWIRYGEADDEATDVR